VFSRGDTHVLSSSPGTRAIPGVSPFSRHSAQPSAVYELGGGGPERARVACGVIGCDERPFDPLLLALPDVIHLPSEGSKSAANWLGMLLHVAANESRSGRAGSGNVLARLSELLFVEMIRRHVETRPLPRTGWLASLRDPVVGRALAALHGSAAEPWTVERLARAVGLSRSVLAERFSGLVGLPPIQYLALWRMQLASRLLVEGGQVAAVADAVGYGSEAAFSRAFKKAVGAAPASWRRVAAPEASGASIATAACPERQQAPRPLRLPRDCQPAGGAAPAACCVAENQCRSSGTEGLFGGAT
jgi:AraC-like DNA-binding protein